LQNCNQFTDFKHIPSLSHSFKNTSNLRGFVITLESCSCVLQCTSSTVPSLVKSRKKWNFISICLLLPCMTGFFDNFMAKLLSQKMIVHLLWIFPSFSRTRLNQTSWHAQYAAAMNSASIMDRDFLTVLWPNCYHKKWLCIYFEYFLAFQELVSTKLPGMHSMLLQWIQPL